MYYPQSSSSGVPTEVGRLPVNFRRRKERDKVSEVWKTFYISPVEPNAVVCRLCYVTLSYVGGSTSGMRNHLQNKHRHIVPKAFSSTSSPGNSELSNRKSGETGNSNLSCPRLRALPGIYGKRKKERQQPDVQHLTTSGWNSSTLKHLPHFLEGFLAENLPIPSISPPPQPSQLNHSSSCFPATSTQNNSSSSPTCLSPPSPYTGNGENNSGSVSSRLAREVAVMCASDLLSPTLVNGKGFHRIFRLLSGGTQTPDLNNLTEQTVRSSMKDLQFSLRLKIQRQLSSCARGPNGEYKKDVAPKRRPVSLILCPWTYIDASSNNEFWDFDGNSTAIQSMQYVDVRAQFLGDDWQPESRLLGTLPLPPSHTSIPKPELEVSVEKLSVALRNLVSAAYEMTDSQIVACVFPKCPVLDACVASFGWPSVPCVSHILDDVVQHAFDSSPVVAVDDSKSKHDASASKTMVHCVKDLIRIGIDLWKNEKKPKSGNIGDACHDADNHMPSGVDALLDNLHKLSEHELHKAVFNLKKGTWRVWCHLLERLSELTETEMKDSRFNEWKRNVLSILPTVTRLGTAWEAFCTISSGTNISDDVPLLSCALPILCSLPFCPSAEEPGNSDDVSESQKPSSEKGMPESGESVRVSRSGEDPKEGNLEFESVGSSVRHKLKVSLDTAVNLVKSEELKGLALLMALAAFMDPRHKALLFLSSLQREEVQQEVIRLMAAEECQVNIDLKPNRDSPNKSGESRKRTSSLGSVSSSYQKRSKLEDLLHGVFGYSTASDITDISHEIEHYIGEPIAPLSQIPGAWWRQRESKYPRLSQLARRLLTIPASVSTGRGGTSTLHLSPEDITLVLFLHSNLTPSDLEEMGFEVEGEEESWRKHPRGEEEEGDRDDGMDMREDGTRVDDYDDTARVIGDEHFYEMEPETHVIKVEPPLINE